MPDQPSIVPQTSPPPEAKEIRQQTPEEARQELQQAIDGSNDVLATATTTFTLFPDTVTIDRAKVTVLKRTFLRTAQVASINVADVMNATASVGPLFGAVCFYSRVLNGEKPFKVGLFWRKDALRIKRVLQGYLIALERNINCSVLPTQELVEMLYQLGEDDHVNSDV